MQHINTHYFQFHYITVIPWLSNRVMSAEHVPSRIHTVVFADVELPYSDGLTFSVVCVAPCFC